MTLDESIIARHSVRKYADKKISTDIRRELQNTTLKSVQVMHISYGNKD